MHRIKVRGVIIDQNKIFFVKDLKRGFFCLPGGTLEDGENFKECLKREILEELGVEAEIGEFIYMREFMNGENLQLDIWFKIDNFNDFYNISKENATHCFEISDEGFYELDKLDEIDVKPGNIKEILQGEKFKFLSF